MTFAAPVWILVGAVALALTALGLRAADRRRGRDLEQFATQNILPDLTRTLSPRRRRLKRGLVLAASGLLFLALAGPEIGFDWEETERRGIDVLIAVDVSKSMLARDIQPDRLRRAKLAVDDLVQRLGGDRLGLIAFAGTAFLQCPLTLDHNAFDRSLAALSPGIIKAPGSNLASALDVAKKALESEARNVKLLILFSDGEDLRGGALSAAERAAEDDIHVFTVGVGTPAGELIPLADEGDGAFVKDEDGRIVKSRLDEATLKKVAEITGGFYVPLGPRAEGIDELVERALAPIPREELASRLRRVPRNQYQWPLALALLLLVLEPFVGERRRAGASAAVALLLLTGGSAVAASPDSAAQLYQDESYEAAVEEYRELIDQEDDPRLDLNLGAAAYRGGDFGGAASAFAKALRAEDEALREEAFYDLGNAQYRIGEQTVQSNPQETIAAWEQSIAAYEEALSLDEADEDARFNRDFVQKKLDELKQQQEQQQDQENDQDQEQDQDQQENENQDQQDQDQQQNENQDQQDQNQNQDQQPPGQDERDEDHEKEEPQKPEEEEEEEEEPEKEGDDPQDQSPDDGRNDDEAPPSEQPSAPNEPPPGQLSPEEARDLLDSLQGDEEFMPMVPMAPAGSSDDPRDW